VHRKNEAKDRRFSEGGSPTDFTLFAVGEESMLLESQFSVGRYPSRFSQRVKRVGRECERRNSSQKESAGWNSRGKVKKSEKGSEAERSMFAFEYRPMLLGKFIGKAKFGFGWLRRPNPKRKSKK